MHEKHTLSSVRTATIHLAALLLISGSALAQAPAMPDAQVEANVLKALAGSPELGSEHITTNTVYGTVTLTGSVKDEAARRLAENLTSRAEGVKKVVDELTLAPGSGSYGQMAGQAAGQGTNPTLQSDGTMAPPAGQGEHAPDPDAYAAQHGMAGASDSNAPANSQNNVGGYPQQGQQQGPPPAQPGYRQPYGGPYGGPQQNQQNPQSAGNSYPAYPPNGQPYPQNGPPQPYYPNPNDRRNPPPPPPYGAQAAGQPVTVPQGSLLRIRINEGLDTKHTQPGTPFDAVVLNDVVADGAVAIPRGASVQGKVTESKEGGVLRGHGEIALQLTQVTLGGKSFPLVSDVWTRDGQGKGGQTAANAIGLGATGAIIGAIAGGGAGAGIGALAGGAAGVGVSAAQGSREVIVPSEAILTFHLAQPAPVATVSQAEMDRLSYGVPVGAQQQGAPQMRRRYPAPYYGPAYYPRPYGYPYPY